MDFNFFIAQSRARHEPSQQDRYGARLTPCQRRPCVVLDAGWWCAQ
jgi:hypothetical protein